MVHVSKVSSVCQWHIWLRTVLPVKGLVTVPRFAARPPHPHSPTVMSPDLQPCALIIKSYPKQ